MNLETFQNSVFPVKNKLFRFSFRLLGNSEEAKDVVQEVFIKVWKGRDQLSEIQNLEAWCMRITKNLSLDRLRQQQRQATDSIEKGFQVQHSDLTLAKLFLPKWPKSADLSRLYALSVVYLPATVFPFC